MFRFYFCEFWFGLLDRGGVVLIREWWIYGLIFCNFKEEWVVSNILEGFVYLVDSWF